MTKDKRLLSITFRVAAVLLLLVAITTSIVLGQFASYKTAAPDSDNARVARFQITESGTLTQTLNVSLVPGETIDITLQVTNGSEVAIDYSVIAKNIYENLPLTLSVLEGETEATQTRLNVGESKNLVLRISWPSDKNDAVYAGQVDLIRVILTATQVD